MKQGFSLFFFITIFMWFLLGPLSVIFQQHSRFFEWPLPILGIYFLIAIIFASFFYMIDSWLRRLKLFATADVFEYFLVAIWIFFTLIHFSNYLPIIKNIPHIRKTAFLIGVFLLYISYRYVKLSNTEKIFQTTTAILVFISIFLAVHHNSFLKFPIFEREFRVGNTANPSKEHNTIFHILFDTFALEHALRANPHLLDVAGNIASKYHLTLYINHFATHSTTTYALPEILSFKDSQPLQEYSISESSQNIFRFFFEKGFYVTLYGQTQPFCRLFSEWTHQCKTSSSPDVFKTEIFNSFVLFVETLHPALSGLLFKTDAKNAITKFQDTALFLMDNFDDFHANKDQYKNSTYSFLHVLLPHSPFILNRDCKEEQSWKEKPIPLDFNEDETYRFGEQTLCTLKKLDFFLGELQRIGVLDQAKILIHSDHARVRERTQERLSDPFTDMDIREGSHIIAFTKIPGQKKSEIVNELTSNSSVANFLENPSAKGLKAEESISFGFYRYWTHDVVNFSSEDGKRWVSKLH